MNTGRKIYLLACFLCYSASSATLDWNWLRNSCVGKQCSVVVNKAYNHPYLAVASTVAIAVALKQVRNWHEKNKQESRALTAQFRVKEAIDRFAQKLNESHKTNVYDPMIFVEADVNNLPEWYNFWEPIHRYVIDEKIIPADTANHQGVTPLYALVKIMNVNGVAELIKHGANKEHQTHIILPSENHDTPFKAAYRLPNDRWDLREKQANILSLFGDPLFSNALQDAKAKYARAVDALDDPDVAKDATMAVKSYITQSYINPNYQIPKLHNRTAFHIAAQTNNQDLGQYLYDNKANPLIIDGSGNTVLDAACDMLKQLPEGQRENNFYWKLLKQEKARLQAEQRKERECVVPRNVMPRRNDGSSPFDILHQAQVLKVE